MGVSVLPSLVMSGAFLPLASALFQSVVRLVQGTQTTLTLVLAYCGKSLWNWATTPFIQETWDGTEAPIRHTVSCAGAGGRLHRGTAGAAGEIGYLPVHGAPLHTDIRHPASGGFQSLAGGAAVRALAARYGFPAATAAEAVAAAVSSPSAGSAAFLDDLAQRVAVGVASVCVVLDPGLVVLGGEVGRAGGTALASRVAAAVAAIFPARPRVVPTGVPGEPVLRGAMLAAVDQARAALLASVADPSRPQ